MTSVMHDFNEVRERPPAAGPFYAHPYGGIARDIPVTKEGFARFFELDVEAMELAAELDSMWFGKVIDITHTRGECLGYRIRYKGKISYSITMLDNSHGALMDHAVRTTVQNHSN